MTTPDPPKDIQQLPELPPEYEWDTKDILRAKKGAISHAVIDADGSARMWPDNDLATAPPSWTAKFDTQEEACKVVALRLWLGERT